MNGIKVFIIHRYHCVVLKDIMDIQLITDEKAISSNSQQKHHAQLHVNTEYHMNDSCVVGLCYT